MSTRQDRHPRRPAHPTKHPEQIEPTWPTHDGEMAVTEMAAETQGAQSPFGDVALPLPLERHGRKWTVRDPGSDRHDADY